MRLAFVTVGDTSRPTGGYLYNRRLMEGLRKNGVEVEQVVPCGASPEEQAEAAPDFGEAFQTGSYDAVVVDALARVVCAPHLDRWRAVRPVVALVHELPGIADPSVSGREREFEGPLLRSDRIVVPSRHGREVLISRHAPGDRVAVVPPGFDNLTSPETPKPPGGGTVRALCVAQWIPRKGILELVQAWKTVDRAGAVRALLHLAGETDADPHYASRVREAVADDPSVLVHGAVDDATLARLYATADLFVLPSRYEGYGIVFAEALSHGLPVVACSVGPVPDLVGEAALLVPSEDPAALPAALERFLSDAGLRTKKSAVALRRAKKLPRWADTVDEFQLVVRKTIEERQR